MNRETKIIGTYENINPGGPAMPKFDTPITPKENFFRFVSKDKKAVWTPNEIDIVSVLPKMIPDNVARGLVDDPEPFDPAKEAGGYDLFGVHWTFVPQVGGSMETPGKHLVPDIMEWEKYVKMPDLDALDWEGGAEKLKPILNDGRVKYTMLYTGFFERLISFMGFEGAAMALIDEEEQEAVHRLFDKLCEVYDGYLMRMKKYYDIDIVTFHDDWGSQRAPFFSLDTCMEMLVPYVKRVCQSAHKYGIVFEFHSCGKNELLIDAILATGADLWAGQNLNDWEALAPKCEGKIIFHIGWNKFDPSTMTKEWYLEDALKGYDKFKDYHCAWIIPSRRYLPGISDEFYIETYKRSFNPEALEK